MKSDDDYENEYHKHMYDTWLYDTYLELFDIYCKALKQNEAREAMQEFRGLDKEEE